MRLAFVNMLETLTILVGAPNQRVGEEVTSRLL